LEALPIDARLDDSPPIQIYGGAYRRDPFAILCETIADLHGRGIGIEAGAVFLTGSSSLPTPIRRGQTLIVRIGDLPAMRLAFT
jgi:2-keto-4-pentenoate hydratase